MASLPQSSSYTRFSTRKMPISQSLRKDHSKHIWLYGSSSIGLELVPAVILFTSLASQEAQAIFRAQPSNLSYEFMTFAVGLAAVFASAHEAYQAHKSALMILVSAFYSFRIAWPLTHSILNFVINCYGAGILWLVLGFLPSLASLTAFKLVYENPSQLSGRLVISCCLCGGSCCVETALRIVVVAFVIGLVFAPIPLPWSGPPEPFIRWHDYSINGELLWRGTFCNLAVHNFLSAIDPAGRHRPYVIFMSAQGIIHASTMLKDHRVAASCSLPNGNPEHAIEISGFYMIGIVLGSLLLLPESPDLCHLQQSSSVKNWEMI